MARSRNHCCCGKAISITYSECVSVALGIQHAERMRPIIYLELPYFFPTAHKRQDCGGGGIIGRKMCVYILALPFCLPVLRRNQRDAIVNIQGVPGGMCQTSGGCSLC